MKRFLLLLAMVFTVSLATVATEAEAAKRMGGGKSLGTQRQAAPDKSPNTASPTVANTPAAGAAAPAASSRSWMGPVAGLAAGLGLAALASHLGFGDELATMVMIGILAAAVMAVVGLLMRRRAAKLSNGSAPAGMQYAHAGGMQGNGMQGGQSGAHQAPAYNVSMPATGSSINKGGIGSGIPRIPADFDVQAFERNAKFNFVRLQAAHDAGDLEQLREFTTPELFYEMKCDYASHTPAAQPSQVLDLRAEVTDFDETTERYLVSVRFTGLIHTHKGEPDETFDERWHLVKPLQGNGGWLLAGIQQIA